MFIFLLATLMNYMAVPHDKNSLNKCFILHNLDATCMVLDEVCLGSFQSQVPNTSLKKQ